MVNTTYVVMVALFLFFDLYGLFLIVRALSRLVQRTYRTLSKGVGQDYPRQQVRT